MPTLHVRGCTYTQAGYKPEQHGIAVYASRGDGTLNRDEPMFIIPLDCSSIADLVTTPETIRLGSHLVPITARVEED